MKVHVASLAGVGEVCTVKTGRLAACYTGQKALYGRKSVFSETQQSNDAHVLYVIRQTGVHQVQH